MHCQLNCDLFLGAIMSPVAASGTGVFSSVFSAELKALQTAPTAPDAKAAADDLARAVKKAGLASLL